LAVHAGLLSLPRAKAPRPAAPPAVVPVVETELARVEPEKATPAETAPPPPLRPTPPPPAVEPEPPAPSPQPALAKMAEPSAGPADGRGDLAADPDGRREPELRIDWGTSAEAQAALEAGRMQVVILDSGSGAAITHVMEREGSAWQRKPYRPPITSTRFSNRVRIVDEVPAFSRVRRTAGLAGDERLAILVPVAIERMLQSAQLEAAFRRGLTMSDVLGFGGRFTLDNGNLTVRVTHVQQKPKE
jgi:hypothetical protein